MGQRRPDIFEKLKEMEANSRPLHEFVFTERFTVENVVSSSHSTTISPMSELVIGSRIPGYSGGFTSGMILKVTPENSSIPIEQLIFSGFSAVRAGDIISARIPRYLENDGIERVRLRGGPIPSQENFLYTDRDYHRNEHAIEFGILDSNGNLLRTDRSTDYGRFQKK